MADKKTKTQKIDEAFDKADKVAETVKEFTPGPIDAQIDSYKETAKVGWGIAKMLKGLFQKKK